MLRPEQPEFAEFALARESFERALEQPASQRRAWLRRELSDDSLFEYAWRLVQADSEADARNFLPLPEEHRPAEFGTNLEGAQLGPFRLLRRIGSGGMGTVWEAQQEQPKRRVALKLLHAGSAQGTLLRRFLAESEILARLRHPGIAQVYASGVHELEQAGLCIQLPWYALELLEDARDLVTHARERKLNLRQRLELFLEVCTAVEHAHARGVIHRDLKPANLPVGSDGRPKVIDFGIARSFDPALGETRDQTQAGELLGSLRAMAPEQLSTDGELLDVRVDVYALGAVLYELLLGRPPLELEGLSIFEAVSAVRERAPPAPRSLDAHLPRELEWILLRCLEKERERRYASVTALAVDLRAHLEGLPVSAGPPSRWYHARKFVTRHALACALGLTAFLSLVAGLWSTRSALGRESVAKQDAVRKSELAQAETAKKSQLAEMLAFAATEARRATPEGELTLRAVLEKLVQAMERGHHVSPEVAGVLSTSLVELFRASGEPERALELAQSTLEALDQNGLGETRDAATLWSLVAIIQGGRGELESARQANARARAFQIEADREHWSEQVFLCTARIAAMIDQGQLIQAIPEARAARQMALLAGDALGDASAATAGTLASLLVANGAAQEALEIADWALAAELALHGELHAHTLEARCSRGGALIALGKPEEGRDELARASAGLLELEGPTSPRVLSKRLSLAAAERALGRREQALALLQEINTQAQATLPAANLLRLAITRDLCSLLADLGRSQEALELLQREQAAAEGRVSREHPMLLLMQALESRCRAQLDPTLRAECLEELHRVREIVEGTLGKDSGRARELRTWIAELEGPASAKQGGL